MKVDISGVCEQKELISATSREEAISAPKSE
jgi:hypothetical protein